MKWVLAFCGLLIVSMFSHSRGYEKGLRDSPDFAAAQQRQNDIREFEYADRIERMADYVADNLEECIPIVENASIDIGEYCREMVMESYNAEAAARADEYRDRY